MTFLLFLLAIIFLSSVTAQRTCFPGTFRNGTICETCPPGTYSPGYNRLSCTKCPKGTFRTNPGAKSRRQCLSCAPGTASKVLGAASCEPCEPGKDSLARSISCHRCPAGSELATAGTWGNLKFAAGCEKCQRDYFAPERGSNVCSPCPIGKVAEQEGATKCTKCPPGTYRSERYTLHFTCKPCLPGTFFDKFGSRFCGRCPPGTFSDSQSTRCQACPRNMFNNRIPATGCEPCPTGTSTIGLGAAGCKHHTKGCPYGTFEDERGECIACSPGEKLDPLQRVCVPCEENEVSDGGATTVCQKCPSGKVPLSDKFFKEKFQCVCAPGTIEIIGLGCVPCPAGHTWVDSTWRFTRGDSKVTGPFSAECFKCGVGSFAEPGSVECTKCPLNTFADDTGSETCEPCPSGFKSPTGLFRHLFSSSYHSDRKSCVNEETGCGPGEILADKGGCKTVACPFRNRYLALDYAKRKRCLTCSDFEKFVTDSSGIGRCISCSDYAFSHGKGSTECTKCPAGRRSHFAPITRRVVKCDCKDDEKWMNGECVKICPAGWATRLISRRRDRPPTITPSLSRCIRCADVSPRLFALRTGIGCVECPKDMISVNSTTCVPCPDGAIVARNVFGELINACVAN